MTVVKNSIEELNKENVTMTEEEQNALKNQEEAKDTLESLRQKLAQKKAESEMTAKIVATKERSLSFGIIGVGQAGNRIAQAFYDLGYDAIAINTAQQDLKFITLPSDHKLLLEGALSGAAKERSLGQAAAENYKDEIRQLVHDKLDHTQIFVICSSASGGTGSGSLSTIVDILTEFGKPVICLLALPMDSEDVLSKSNSLESLSEIAKMVQSKKISNLIMVDNAKIETIYHDVNQLDFYSVANKAIVEPLDAFNSLSAMPSQVKPIDGAELAKLLLDGEGLTTYGVLDVTDLEQPTSIAEAVLKNLDGNLLSGGMNLQQAKYVGVFVVANEATMRSIPSSHINYALSEVQEKAETPKGVFKGIVVQPNIPDGVVRVYSCFSGLGLPEVKAAAMKAEVQALNLKTKSKDDSRNLSLSLDTGKEAAVSNSQQMKAKITSQSSAFGKLLGQKKK